MKATELYTRLDEDFGVKDLRDDWSFMKFNKFISPGFKKNYIGTVLDNATEIRKVFTLTMPDTDILEKLISSKQTDILLFSHHAMGYDPTMQGFPFYDIPEYILEQLKQQRISLYVLHVPLDKNGEYSTSVNLAKYLDFKVLDEFCEYMGIKCGVICKTEMKTAGELAEYVRTKVGHDIKLIRNGTDVIRNERIAIAAGGGSVDFAANEIAELGINMYLTGCTRKVPTYQPVTEFHRIIKEKNINVIGATHYTTEKFACIAMVDYFKKLGLQAEFLEGKYFLEDL